MGGVEPGPDLRPSLTGDNVDGEDGGQNVAVNASLSPVVVR